MKKKCKEDTVGCSSWIRKAGIFAMVAKISLGLRKFRNHSENFAILAKLENFARLAKFTVPSDSCHSRVIRNQQNLYPKFLLLP